MKKVNWKREQGKEKKKIINNVKTSKSYRTVSLINQTSVGCKNRKWLSYGIESSLQFSPHWSDQTEWFDSGLTQHNN